MHSGRGMIRAGELNRLVELQRYSEERDERTGETTETWRSYGTAWAQVIPVSAAERERADQMNAVVTHKVRMRWDETVTVRDRIKIDARLLVIESAINVDERDEELQLMCREETQD